MARIDGLLLGAFLLASVALLATNPGTRARASQGDKKLSWQEEEIQVKERLKSALSLDREDFERRLHQDPQLFWRFQGVCLGILLLFVGSLLAWARIFLQLFLGKPILRPLGSPPEPTWGFPEIFRLVLGVLVFAQWALLLQRGFLSLFYLPWFDRHLASLGNTLLIDGLVILGAVFCFTRGAITKGARSTRPLWEKGARSTRPLLVLRFGIVSYLAFLPLLAMLVGMVAFGLHYFQVEPSPQPIFTIYLSETRGPVIGWLLVLATALGPVAEELFFRGIVYGWLRVRIGVSWGLCISSLLFAALHGDAVGFLPILGLGFLFGWVYERTGSLVAPVAIHVFHNGGMLTLASFFKTLVLS